MASWLALALLGTAPAEANIFLDIECSGTYGAGDRPTYFGVVETDADHLFDGSVTLDGPTGPHVIIAKTVFLFAGQKVDWTALIGRIRPATPPGTYTVTIKAVDWNGPTVTDSCTIEVI